jgi:hydrogenase-4 component E
MLNLLIILFAITLFYFSVSERFRTYSMLIAVQGVLLFGMSFLELAEVHLVNFVFIAAETLLFKAIIVPVLLYRIINRTGVYKVHSKALPAFYILIFTMTGLLVSIVLSKLLYTPRIDSVYMTIALFTLFTGIILIITHKRIFSHMIGFLVIENAVFMFSMAVGAEMTMLINIGILLDIFVSVLIIGVMINRIGTQYNDLEAENLTRLKH